MFGWRNSFSRLGQEIIQWERCYLASISADIKAWYRWYEWLISPSNVVLGGGIADMNGRFHQVPWYLGGGGGP